MAKRKVSSDVGSVPPVPYGPPLTPVTEHIRTESAESIFLLVNEIKLKLDEITMKVNKVRFPY